MPMRPPSFANTLPLRVYERDAFSFMSLSLIMTARSSVGDRLWRLAEVATASAMCRHCDGAHAGVCQRIFSFTAQIVLVRQLGAAPEVSEEKVDDTPEVVPDGTGDCPLAAPAATGDLATAVGTGVFGRAPDAETAP